VTDESQPPAGLAPGQPVRVQFTKWGGGRHWGIDVLWLGEDEHGRWLGWPAGTVWSRPGADFSAQGLQVGLFPRDRGFAAAFYEAVAAYAFRVYVDVATPPVWGQGVVTSVDLDLDVVQTFEGEVAVVDQDEFAQHQVELGYPPELVAEAQAECERVREELAAGAPHFAEPLAAHWRGVLAGLVR
jgi:uncharacterized protein